VPQPTNLLRQQVPYVTESGGSGYKLSPGILPAFLGFSQRNPALGTGKSVGHFRPDFLEALGTDWAFEASDGDTIVTVDGLLFFYVASGATITVQGGKLKVESNEEWSRLRKGLRAVVGDAEVLARLEAGLGSKFIITTPPPPPKTPEEAGLVAAGNVGPADDSCVMSEEVMQSR
jgi:hypothetical protein